VEFAKAAADAGVPPTAKWSRACPRLHLTHSQTSILTALIVQHRAPEIIPFANK
jgi:hypothetical protein